MCILYHYFSQLSLIPMVFLKVVLKIFFLAVSEVGTTKNTNTEGTTRHQQWIKSIKILPYQ